MCACSVVLLVYLAFAGTLTSAMAGSAPVGATHINVADSLHTGFITADDIARDFAPGAVAGAPRCSVSLREIERSLLASDKIERANVALLNDGSVAIDVVPMVPVARVFDHGGRRSYYINAEGKRIGAEARFHIDAQLDALVSTIVSEADGDIIIVPAMRGHVVNFGDTTDMADKFARLRRFYRTVPGVRGWDSYDTISVKWRGQVVATRRAGRLTAVQLAVQEQEYNDADIETVQGHDPNDPDNGIVPDDAYN